MGVVKATEEWFSQRAYCLSGNKVLMTSEGSALPATTLARQIYRPRSAQEIANLVKSSSAKSPIACVCGGHESSNASMFASSEAILLDLVHLKSIEFQRDGESMLVTVGAGVIFRELVDARPARCGVLAVVVQTSLLVRTSVQPNLSSSRLEIRISRGPPSVSLLSGSPRPAPSSRSSS